MVGSVQKLMVVSVCLSLDSLERCEGGVGSWQELAWHMAAVLIIRLRVKDQKSGFPRPGDDHKSLSRTCLPQVNKQSYRYYGRYQCVI
jgi:hypothetical protein